MFPCTCPHLSDPHLSRFVPSPLLRWQTQPPELERKTRTPDSSKSRCSCCADVEQLCSKLILTFSPLFSSAIEPIVFKNACVSPRRGFLSQLVRGNLNDLWAFQVFLFHVKVVHMHTLRILDERRWGYVATRMVTTNYWKEQQ